MTVREYLDAHGVKYEWMPHATSFTAPDLAQQLHQSGHHVVKPVVMEADGQFVMCAVPSCLKVDPERVRQALHADRVAMASEKQLASLFDGCELGAEPPIGEMFRMHTLMDDSLCDEPQLTFQAGTHRDAVTMPLGQFLKLAHPMIAPVTYGD